MENWGKNWDTLEKENTDWNENTQSFPYLFQSKEFCFAYIVQDPEIRKQSRKEKTPEEIG
jgi:hypothetical protein